MKKPTAIRATIAAAVASMLVLPMAILGISHVNAIGEGQIERGDIYYSRNVTKGSAFADPTAADKCETLQYKIRMHNPGATPVTNVRVQVNLPGGAGTTNTSTATITADNASPATVSDTATVNISTAQTIIYKPGSTQLLNASNAVIGNLPDAITGAGVTIGDVGVSLNEVRYVQFQATIDCPPTPCTPPNPECTPPPAPSDGVCKLLNLEVINREKREVKATITGEVNNATIVGYKIDFGDGATSDKQTENHQYTQDGTYTVKGQVQIRLADNTTVTRESGDCVKQVTFKTDTPPTVTPPPSTPGTSVGSAGPSFLPATGPADVGIIALVVSAISGIGYYVAQTRRNLF